MQPLPRPPVFTWYSGYASDIPPRVPSFSVLPALASIAQHARSRSDSAPLLATKTGQESLSLSLTPPLEVSSVRLSPGPSIPDLLPLLPQPCSRACRRQETSDLGSQTERRDGRRGPLCVHVASLHPYSPDCTFHSLSPALASRLRSTFSHPATGMLRRLPAFPQISECSAVDAKLPVSRTELRPWPPGPASPCVPIWQRSPWHPAPRSG